MPSNSLLKPPAVVVDRLCIEAKAPLHCIVELKLAETTKIAFHLFPSGSVIDGLPEVQPPMSSTRTTRSLCSDLCDVSSCRSINSRGGTGSIKSCNSSLNSTRRSRCNGRPSQIRAGTNISSSIGERQVFVGEWTSTFHRLHVGDQSRELAVRLYDKDTESVLIDDSLPLSALTQFQRSKFAITGPKAKLSISLELQPPLRPRSVIIKGFSLPGLAKQRRLIAAIQYYLTCTIGPQCARMDFTSADLANTHIDPMGAECSLNQKTGPERSIFLEHGFKAICFKLVRKHFLRADSVIGAAMLPVQALSPERATAHSLILGTNTTLVLLLRLGYPIE
eukprot:GGOE01003757.1.p1 GENE.GGOE01003757.1~~GGOE01003757.1.p1  ORF type:complete len:361 (+),score=28.98 GGOE01003757.1:81-1085(+)